ncbi:MAG: hypothetical protein LPH21_15095, partial [Shewanella sp.]|nr:hypothetical protein [Shewanella sp.]
IITILLGCVFATQAYASNKFKVDPSETCDYLVVHISKNILDDYNLLRDNIVMNNGISHGCHATLGDTQDCQFEQGNAYGPDATLSFKRKTDGQIATVRAQQNFCFWEAGSITVAPISGKWEYRTREGSYGSNRHGEVWLDQVSLNN